MNRSSRYHMFFKISIPKNLAIFTGKHLRQSFFCNKVKSLQACNFSKKRFQHRCLPVIIAKFLRTAFFVEHVWWLLLFGMEKLQHRSLIRLSYDFIIDYQRQPSRGVLRKRCSEKIHQIYRRTPMPKCDFNKVAQLH